MEKGNLVLKVRTFSKGHKIWHNLPLVLDVTLYLESKKGGKLFQIFVALSECLNFIRFTGSH